MKPTLHSGAQGFTLVELMVALFIFALISAAGVTLLSYSVSAQASAGTRLDEVAALRRVGAILTADLAQAAPRISRDGSGAPQVAFEGGTGAPSEVALAFVRRGWRNDGATARSSLQKVEYRLVDDRLERRVWDMVDGGEPRSPSTVLSGVRALKLRYRTDAIWRERWDTARPGAMPKAVEAIIDIQGLGPVRQVFLAGTGYP
jgi:general secretion pathway protein J